MHHALRYWLQLVREMAERDWRDPMGRRGNPSDPFRDRLPTSDVHPRASFPRTLRLPTPAEADRGIAIAYSTANFAVYRAVIDRLRLAERFRVETQFGAYEMSRGEFEQAFPGIVASRSYRTGSDSMLDKCYYVVGPPPAGSDQFLVDPR
jgi:hypothetical protein